MAGSRRPQDSRYDPAGLDAELLQMMIEMFRLHRSLTSLDPTRKLIPMLRATSYGFYYYYATRTTGRGWRRTR